MWRNDRAFRSGDLSALADRPPQFVLLVALPFAESILERLEHTIGTVRSKLNIIDSNRGSVAVLLITEEDLELIDRCQFDGNLHEMPTIGIIAGLWLPELSGVFAMVVDVFGVEDRIDVFGVGHECKLQALVERSLNDRRQHSSLLGASSNPEGCTAEQCVGCVVFRLHSEDHLLTVVLMNVIVGDPLTEILRFKVTIDWMTILTTTCSEEESVQSDHSFAEMSTGKVNL